MMIRRGGLPVDAGPVDARDWLYVGPDTATCEKGHELIDNSYGRPDRKNPRCATCQREAMRRYRQRRYPTQGEA